MSKSLNHHQLVAKIADLLKAFDSTRPAHKNYKPGIGPFDEPDLVKEIAGHLIKRGIAAKTETEVDTAKNIDMVIGNQWIIEFKTARPFNNTGTEARDWSKNLTYPYKGNESSIGDAIKLQKLSTVARKCVFVIGFERVSPPVISLDPVLGAFELLTQSLIGIPLGKRVEEKRGDLVHPVHQTLRCVSWEVDPPARARVDHGLKPRRV